MATLRRWARTLAARLHRALSEYPGQRGALTPVRLVRMFGSLTAQLFNHGLRTGAGEKFAGFIGDVRFAAELLYLLSLFFRHGIVVSVQSHRAPLWPNNAALAGAFRLGWASATGSALREMAFHR